MTVVGLVLDGIEHGIGAECRECWSSYPRVHEDCGGFVHADFGDENANGDYWLVTRCEACGESE